MKKILILCLSVLFSNFLIAQESVSITGSSSVEVGVPNNFTFTFNPQYPTNQLTNVTADSYIITGWAVSTGTNGIAGSIPGYIGTPSNTSSYYNDNTYNNSNPVTIPIQWSNGTFSSSDNITVKVSGIYRKISSGASIGYFNFITNTKPVTVERIVTPIINGASTVASCDQTYQTYSYSNATNSNNRLWTVTGGATIVGSATETVVTVNPPLTGNYDVYCTVNRTGGNPNYKAVGSKTISRTNRTIQITTANSAYICPGLGKIFQIVNNPAMTAVAWSAPDCSISAESIVNGKRQVTITPNASITGVSLEVTATATYTGGCTANNTISLPLGTPRTTIANANFISSYAPTVITATANQNYLQFTINAPLGNYSPAFYDWQYEKISGNFFFNGGSSGYTATAVYKQVSDLYLTGPNPMGSGLKFRARVKGECGYGPWTEYIWNDGTSTPPVVTPPPAKYFKVTPIPLGTSPITLSLLDPAVVPPASSIGVKLYNANTGQVLSYTTMFNNYLQFTPSSTSSIMYVTLTFAYDNHTESYTVLR
jgi:hypothetical protein